MKSKCTYHYPLMSGIKSSAFDLFSLSLSETFNLSPPGRYWYIKVQILPWPQLPSTTWPGRSSHLQLLFTTTSSPPPTPFSSPLHPLQGNSTTYLLFLFLLLCQLVLPFHPFTSNLLRLLTRSPLPPFEHNILLFLKKDNRGKTILGIEFVRGSNSNFSSIFKTRHDFANDEHWRYWLLMSTINVDCQCWPPILINNVDYQCWLSMLTTHVDYTCWLPMLTTNVDYQCWLPMLTTKYWLPMLTTNVDYQFDYQCWLPMLTTNVDYTGWLHMLTTNVDYQCWLPMLTSNVDYQCWLPMLTTNIGCQYWL